MFAPTLRGCDNLIFAQERDDRLEHFLIPFIASCIFSLPLYKYAAPLLSGGKVALKQASVPGYIGFVASISLLFFVLYVVCAVGGAILITPFVSGFVNTASDNVMFFVSAGFRLLIAQLIFFVLTLLAGKVFGKTLKVEGTFAAWKTAWALGLVVVLSDLAVTLILMMFVPGFYEMH